MAAKKGTVGEVNEFVSDVNTLIQGKLNSLDDFKKYWSGFANTTGTSPPMEIFTGLLRDIDNTWTNILKLHKPKNLPSLLQKDVLTVSTFNELSKIIERFLAAYDDNPSILRLREIAKGKVSLPVGKDFNLLCADLNNSLGLNDLKQKLETLQNILNGAESRIVNFGLAA